MLSLIDIRNRHFLIAAQSVIDSLPPGVPVDLLYVADRASRLPAPHYYCTYQYALRMVRVLRNGRIRLRNDRRLALWRELALRAERIMTLRGERLGNALSCVLAEGGASRFFISPATAASLIYRYYDHSQSRILIP